MASYVVIFSQVDTCPFTQLPFKDHPSTQAHQTGRKSKPGKHWQ